MAKGLVTPTVPIDDDIALGEAKIYGNYGLPTEIELGSTRGGLKVDIERAIKEIKSDGQYGPHKGLRRYEKFMAKLTIQALCLKYFNRKILSDAESDTLFESKGWTVASGGVYAAETSIVLEGSQSAKGTLTSSGDGIHEVYATSKNLTAFDNGEASTTSDYIGFAIYVTTQDLADLGSADLRISFHMDAEDTETNYYYYDVAASALTADEWTSFKVLKSAFTEAGSGDWSAVTGVSISLNAAPSAEVIFYIDSIELIQAQTKSTIVPVNGGGMSYTDEGDYRKFVPNLTLNDNEYYSNVTVVGMKHSGKPFKIELQECLNDGNISLAFQEKDEVVNSTQFTAHFDSNATVIPLIIRDWDIVA
jgi:hypothetical protein